MKSRDATIADILRDPEGWVKRYAERNNIPPGMELPDKLELEYDDGSKETINTKKE
jgi:arginine decarboxylase-like protein